MTLRVAVDATELASGAPGGVRKALWLLLASLARHAPGVEAVACSPTPLLPPEGVRLLVTGGPARPLLWRRSRALRRALPSFDLFHSPVTAVPLLPGPPRTATVH
ncbi:MAG: hypothetical protein ACREID_06760, partial [Planctomycetota bacterium]